MADLIDFLPSGPALYALEPEDAAGLLIEYFHALDFHQKREVMRTEAIVDDSIPSPFPERYKAQLVVIEGWSWLLQHGLVCFASVGTGKWIG